MERKFYWMHRDDICTTITIASTTNAVYFENHTDEHLLCAFGKEVSPVTMDDFYDLLETRVAPIRENEDDSRTYRLLGYTEFPTIESLISKTFGMIADDFFGYVKRKTSITLTTCAKSWTEVRKTCRTQGTEGT